MDRIEVSEPAILIRISQTYFPDMSGTALYEATRGSWVIGKRRRLARFAMAVAGGIVRAVYDIDNWHKGGSTPYATRNQEELRDDRRWEFTGTLSSQDLQDRYVGKSVSAYFRPGASNPIKYVNCG